MKEKNKNNNQNPTSRKKAIQGHKFFIFLFILFVIAMVSLVIFRPKEKEKILTENRVFQQNNVQSNVVMEARESIEGEDVEISGSQYNEGDSFTGEVLAGAKSPLLNFNKQDYDKAIKSDKLVVLYFYANWCSICKKEVADALLPAFNDLQDDSTIGFRINFKDNETDSDEEALAKEFGVAYQHTKVFLKNGERISKSPDSWDKQRYLEEIQKNIK